MSSNDSSPSGDQAETKISHDQDQAPHEATTRHEGAPAPEDVPRETPDTASTAAPASAGEPTANIGVVGLPSHAR